MPRSAVSGAREQAKDLGYLQGVQYRGEVLVIVGDANTPRRGGTSLVTAFVDTPSSDVTVIISLCMIVTRKLVQPFSILNM